LHRQQQWRNQSKILEGQNLLAFSEQQYFVWDTASQKGKTTRNAENLEGHGPLAALATPVVSSG